MSDVKITDNHKQFDDEMKRKLKNALEAIGMTAEGYAKDDTPVDTGRLRDSMSHKVDDDSVYVGTNVEYGIYVEEGTSRTPAHHMLRNAAQNHSSEYKAIAEAALK